MFRREVGGRAARLIVDDEVDAALAVQVHLLERWLATLVKPSCANTVSSTPGTGDANSTNSKPIRPIGLSNKSAILFFLFRL
jgi:hypothetical protein